LNCLKLVYGNVAPSAKGWLISACSDGIASGQKKHFKTVCEQLYPSLTEQDLSYLYFGSRSNRHALIGYAINKGSDHYGRPGGWMFYGCFLDSKNVSWHTILSLLYPVFSGCDQIDQNTWIEKQIRTDNIAVLRIISKLNGKFSSERKSAKSFAFPLRKQIEHVELALDMHGNLLNSNMLDNVKNRNDKKQSIGQRARNWFMAIFALALISGLGYSFIRLNAKNDEIHAFSVLVEALSSDLDTEKKETGKLQRKLDDSETRREQLQMERAKQDLKMQGLKKSVAEKEEDIREYRLDQDAGIARELETLESERDAANKNYDKVISDIRELQTDFETRNTIMSEGFDRVLLDKVTLRPTRKSNANQE